MAVAPQGHAACMYGVQREVRVSWLGELANKLGGVGREAHTVSTIHAACGTYPSVSDTCPYTCREREGARNVPMHAQVEHVKGTYEGVLISA